MEKAKAIKADVAVKEDFNKGLTAFNEGESLSASSSDESVTASKYIEAEELFLAAYNSAAAKREAALNQLNKAKEDIKTVEAEAEAADKEQSGEGAN
jgi:hypothetical protein